MDNYMTHKGFRWLLCLAITIVITRLISLGMYPLFDTTEARYGEMARIMAQTNNWVTPQFDYNVPFWGKPPFQTWISALSFKILGVNEFAARLPHFLCSVITLLLTHSFLKQYSSKKTAFLGSVILLSTLGFTLLAGTVMTDSALLMATTLAMVSYWRCFNNHNRHLNGLLFFAALSLGMLIKGPVSIVIIGIALVTWSLYQHCFINAIKCLPWASGLTLFLVLTLPWYIWAEIRSPGFIEYFIIGEHFQRFLVSGWEGDLYGTAHREPRGMIWLYWLGCAFPWSFVVLQKLPQFFREKSWKRMKGKVASVNAYLMCWVLAPLWLFSFSGNILPAYVMPGIAALAAFIAIIKVNIRHLVVGASIGGLILISLSVMISTGIISKETEQNLIADETQLNKPLFYWNKRPFSAQFYSKGKAKLIDNPDTLIDYLSINSEFYLAITHTEYQKLALLLSPHCKTDKISKKRILLSCNESAIRIHKGAR